MYVIRERMFRLGEDSDITNEAGQPVLHVDGKVMTPADLDRGTCIAGEVRAREGRSGA